MVEPGLGGMPDGLPHWMDTVDPKWPAGRNHPSGQFNWEPARADGIKNPERRSRIKALGNAVCPAQSAVIAQWIADNLIEVK